MIVFQSRTWSKENQQGQLTKVKKKW